ncbi:riboflavin synthase [Adhaeretor mobilis]|uniref:Riboflavin synthase n=1 Tax=Adhaeretor mobilis TaxID=1930276 RepID=A0A517MYD9_9BACT|nr:riboflavin synthase [Adhaeretor mobilis]QDS99876.1 Riboflavin synthase [Adhaeretor mobilis]
MFTGLVEDLGTVGEFRLEDPGARLIVETQSLAPAAEIGASIAVNGCCLTVVEIDGARLSFEAGEETLSRTNLGELAPGARVNLESSLKVGDSLGGHYVTGHIDGLGSVKSRDDDGQWCTMWFNAPAPLLKQMASKGSIAVDGISLTLVDVSDEAFSVALIPHTLSVTTLGQRAVGDTINLETDVLAKYVERQLGGFRTNIEE